MRYPTRQEQQVRRPAPLVSAVPMVCVMAADPGAVPMIRAFARQGGRWFGLPDSVLDDLCVVVTEYATNAVTHSGSREVAAKISFGSATLSVAVRDRGRWRRPSRPQVEELADHGRGLTIARALDSVIAAGRHHPECGTVAWALLSTATTPTRSSPPESPATLARFPVRQALAGPRGA
ncbi:ATP-binding protein [Kitasatospora sp. NBC_01302]|uniref:ATP-binding protein n=1 Tax=Kitasatospora sp. NBC_01302 TaxID=2903575 RepID=UPI002E0D145F|nr:ATP-binding protein [Kitasatospora sp. NBC_01302]